jgi:hypothetical protein
MRVSVLLLACGTLAAQPFTPGLELNADLLLRVDNAVDLPDRGDIHRGRLWFRPGFEMTPSGWIRFGARASFAVSSDTNHDGIRRFDNFHNDDVSADRLYLAVGARGMELGAGKFAMPFALSEMIWDHDIQPSGLYAVYDRSLLSLRGGVFYRSHIHHDRSTIAGGQLALRHSYSSNWLAEVDAGFLAFNALDQFQPGMERQNSAIFENGRLRFQSAFQLVNGRYWVGYRGSARWPVSVESTYVHNFGASSARNAIAMLAEAGKTGERRDWHFSYSFQKVEREAVVGAFTSDDWWFHSDYHGSRVTVAYTVLPHTFLRLGAVFQRQDGAPTLVKRFQIDLAVQF